MSDDAGGRTEETRGGVFSVSFLALVATQFFVSLNDNMFRWLVVPIGKELMGNAWHDMPAVVQRWMKPEPLALSLGLASFTLPFLVFAAPAGFLADRFSKRNVMVDCKAAEIVVIGLGIAAILLGSVSWMFVMLFILGSQATMFITSKLGAIPEIVRSDKIAAANGVINMVSMAAIIIGTVAGNWLYAPDQARRPRALVDFRRGPVGRGGVRTDHQPVHRPAPARRSGPADPLESRRADGPRPRLAVR